MHRIATPGHALLPLMICFSFYLTAAMGGGSYSYVDLIGRMTDLEYLAALPAPDEASAECTSRDRASTCNSGTGQSARAGTGHVKIFLDGAVSLSGRT